MMFLRVMARCVMMLLMAMKKDLRWVTWLQRALALGAYVWMCCQFYDCLIVMGNPEPIGVMIFFVLVTAIFTLIIYSIISHFEPLLTMARVALKIRGRYVRLVKEIRDEDARREAQAGDLSSVEATHD